MKNRIEMIAIGILILMPIASAAPTDGMVKPQFVPPDDPCQLIPEDYRWYVCGTPCYAQTTGATVGFSRPLRMNVVSGVATDDWYMAYGRFDPLEPEKEEGTEKTLFYVYYISAGFSGFADKCYSVAGP